MTEFLHHLEDDVRHAAGHFRHPAPTIGPDHPDQPQEPPMPLADTSNALKDTAASLRASLEASASAARDALDNHATRLDGLIEDVAAVASIADHPAMQAMERALPVVPAAILQGVTAMLEAVVAEHASRAEQAAPEQAAEPQQAAEPAPDQQAA